MIGRAFITIKETKPKDEFLPCTKISPTAGDFGAKPPLTPTKPAAGSNMGILIGLAKNGNISMDALMGLRTQ